jgi:hypothetical protein
MSTQAINDYLEKQLFIERNVVGDPVPYQSLSFSNWPQGHVSFPQPRARNSRQRSKEVSVYVTQGVMVWFADR